jgi:hypothetical protein
MRSFKQESHARPQTAIITGASRGIGAGLVGDTPHSAELSGARPMIETYPLECADEAYARMMSGNALFRIVLTM